MANKILFVAGDRHFRGTLGSYPSVHHADVEYSNVPTNLLTYIIIYNIMYAIQILYYITPLLTIN